MRRVWVAARFPSCARNAFCAGRYSPIPAPAPRTRSIQHAWRVSSHESHPSVVIVLPPQGRLAPGTEVCGTLAGLAGPPPLELFEGLGRLLAGLQAGGGCYMLVERW